MIEIIKSKHENLEIAIAPGPGEIEEAKEIKCVSIVNENKLSLGNCKIKNIDSYIGCIDKYIIENNCNKTYHFNVISIEFLKSKKPIIKTINEKIIN